MQSSSARVPSDVLGGTPVPKETDKASAGILHTIPGTQQDRYRGSHDKPQAAWPRQARHHLVQELWREQVRIVGVNQPADGAR